MFKRTLGNSAGESWPNEAILKNVDQMFLYDPSQQLEQLTKSWTARKELVNQNTKQNSFLVENDYHMVWIWQSRKWIVLEDIGFFSYVHQQGEIK